MCGAPVGTSASWFSDAHASLRLHGMMREGIRHIVLSPLKPQYMIRQSLHLLRFEYGKIPLDLLTLTLL